MFGSSEEVTDGKKVKEKGIHLFFFSLVWMQRLEKYNENFDVSGEGPSSGVTSGVTQGLRSKRGNSPYIFQVVASLATKAC